MDGEALRQQVGRLSLASATLDHNDVLLVERICEAAKLFLQERSSELVRRACGMPVLQCYSSDATPGQSEERFQLGSLLDPTAVVRRRGRCTAEYLMHCCFLKACTPAGITIATPVFQDGLPLSAGKSMWHLFSAMRGFVKTLPEHGHPGIAVQFYCFDRGCFESLQHKIMQFHATLLPTPLAEPEELARMKQWYCSAACALHDGQNALKWSLYFYMSDASLMKNTHVMIAALRNSYEQLATHLGGWLQESVVFEEDDTYEKQTWSSLWVALGVLPQYVELLL